MLRKPRFNLPSVPQYVIQSGKNREQCFYSEADYRHYLDDLMESSFKYYCRVHAYVLMTNHVHLLVTPMESHSASNMAQAFFTLCEVYKRFIWRHGYIVGRSV